MKKVLLVTEYLNPPYDEGIKKTVYNIFKKLDEKYDLLVICRAGFMKDNIHIFKTNPLFWDKGIKSICHEFMPDVLIYFPFASMTFASYLRLFFLKRSNHKAKSIILAMQPKPLKNWQQMIAKFIKPHMALTPSPQLHAMWNKMNIKNKLLPLYTNLADFNPIKNDSQKLSLREKYNIPTDKYVISHMGHLNEGRNLESLIPIQQAGYQIVIVGSSSTPSDSKGPKELRKKLIDSGIIIINRYINNIAEIYQLSDLYIFPVVANCSSIGLPLSILEARACGIPVLTTEFGSAKMFLDEDFGNIYYAKPHDFLDKVEDIRRVDIDRLKTKVSQINKQYNDIIFSEIEG
jgi:glycosyltransferase involved in cell wall biosynthesis